MVCILTIRNINLEELAYLQFKLLVFNFESNLILQLIKKIRKYRASNGNFYPIPKMGADRYQKNGQY